MSSTKVNMRNVEKALELIYDYLNNSESTNPVEIIGFSCQNVEGSIWHIMVLQMLGSIPDVITFRLDIHHKTIEIYT